MEGAFKHSRIWINGKYAGENRSGYLPKIYDITSFFTANERSFRWPGSTCSITVHVDASEQQGHWHEGAGIYRDVQLMAVPKCYIDHYTPYIKSHRFRDGKAILTVAATVVNASDVNRKVILHHEICAENTAVVSGTKTFTLKSGEKSYTEMELIVPSPRKWDVEDPFLYDLQSRLEVPEIGSMDLVDTTFGIRDFSFEKDGTFLLNGRPLEIRGGCIHNDFAVFGTAVPESANAYTVAELKKMGCNLIRSAHNQASESLMSQCDRQGMLFWAEYRELVTSEEDDILYGGLYTAVKSALKHPSIIIWGPANHGGDGNGEFTQILEKANDIVHKLDSTRMTAVALEASSDHNKNGVAMVTDLVGYNGGVNPESDCWVDHGHTHYPERKILISEFGSGQAARGVYENRVLSGSGEKYLAEDGRVFDQTGGYFSNFDLCLRIEEEWQEIRKRPFLYGGIVWSAIDYWGETAGWPAVISQMGAGMDLCRFRKDAFYYFQQEWTTSPMVHLFPPWEHPGKEGKKVPVWVYSNCASVELFLNGRSLGKKAPCTGTHLEWGVIYEPGELKAVALDKDGKILEKSSFTPGDAAVVRTEKIIPLTDGEYMFVKVSIVDRSGRELPYVDHKLEISVKGDIELKGIGSGDPCTKDTAGNRECHLFNGLALAVFRIRGQGEAVFSVAGLPEAKLTF